MGRSSHGGCPGRREIGTEPSLLLRFTAANRLSNRRLSCFLLSFLLVQEFGRGPALASLFVAPVKRIRRLLFSNAEGQSVIDESVHRVNKILLKAIVPWTLLRRWRLTGGLVLI